MSYPLIECDTSGYLVRIDSFDREIPEAVFISGSIRLIALEEHEDLHTDYEPIDLETMHQLIGKVDGRLRIILPK